MAFIIEVIVMKNSLFKVSMISILFLPTFSYAGASSPGANVSRANCWAPLFFVKGVGYYSESFTYSKIGKKHTAYVKSVQKSKTKKRILKSGKGYKTSWRIYAGKVDKEKKGWKVTGYHKEILSSKRKVSSTTRATGCNLTSW